MRKPGNGRTSAKDIRQPCYYLGRNATPQPTTTNFHYDLLFMQSLIETFSYKLVTFHLLIFAGPQLSYFCTHI
jgi:hypothetical protein